MRWCQKSTRSEFRAESSAPVLLTFTHCHPFTTPCAAKHCRFQCFVSLPLVPYSYLLQRKGGVWQRAQAVHLLLHSFRFWGKIVLLCIFFSMHYVILYIFSSSSTVKHSFFLPFSPPIFFSLFFLPVFLIWVITSVRQVRAQLNPLSSQAESLWLSQGQSHFTFITSLNRLQILIYFKL